MTEKEERPNEFEVFDKTISKILSVTPEELKKRLEAAKKAKYGARYPNENLTKD